VTFHSHEINSCERTMLEKIYKPIKQSDRMKSVIKKILDGEVDEDAHRYFVRYGKGHYRRRFLINLTKGKNIKIRTSFEFANDLVMFVKENSSASFSGVVLMKDKIPGKEGKKKKGAFAYEISESSIEEFENAYFYLLNVKDSDIVLKIKKSLPKPGKNEDKIDDKFCSLDLDLKYWEKVRETFFWDVPECKKALIEHDLDITGIEIPPGVDDEVEIRRLAKRKGKITRKIFIDKSGEPKSEERELVA